MSKTRRTLISVHGKTGLRELGKFLAARKVEIVFAFIIFILFCFGCSQRRLIGQREFMNQVTPGMQVTIHDRTGVKYKGIIVEPTKTLSDSTQILMIETEKDKKRHEFSISPAPTRTDVTQISMRSKVHSLDVLTGGMFGMIGGALMGVVIGNAVKSDYDDTLAAPFLGGVIGSIFGFITGAVIVNASADKFVLVLEDKTQ
jgi:hypothetical protein